MSEEPLDPLPHDDVPAAFPDEAMQGVPSMAATSDLSAPPEAQQPAVIAGRSRFPLMITHLVQALWFGSGVFLLLTAAAAFRAAGSASVAADVVGAVLTRWHYIALFAPVLLLFLEWRRSRPFMLVILFIGIVLASFQGFLDIRIRMIRMASPVPISSLSEDDPLRRHFGFLHGMSSLFLIGQVITAAAAVAMREGRDL